MSAHASTLQLLPLREYVHLEQFRAVDGNTCPLANNLSWEDEVLQDLLVDGGEGAATGTLLLYAGRPGGLAEHPTLRNKYDVAVRELLLEFADEANLNSIICK